MTSKENIFDEHFNEVLKHLAAIFHNSEAIHRTAGREADGLEGRKREQNGDVVSLSRLLVTDPFTSKERDFGSSAFSGSEGVGQSIREVEARAYAHLLCDAFEATERFVRHLGIEFYHVKKHCIREKDKKWLTKKMQDKCPDEGTREYYQAYIERIACRANVKDLLTELKNYLPNFREKGEELFSIWQIVQKSRHIVVHNHGRLDGTALGKGIHPDGAKYIENELCKESVFYPGQKVIQPSRQQAKCLVKNLVQFTYVLYVTASKSCGMDPI